jgi:hypothetical protein
MFAPFPSNRLLVVAAFLLTSAAVAIATAWADGPTDNIPDKVRPVPPVGITLPPADAEEIQKGLAELQGLIKDIGTHTLLPDVEIYEKAVRWGVDYKEIYDGKNAKPGATVKKVLKDGIARAKALKEGKTPWTTQTGSVLRGYRSKIDGSVQPYWIVVPKDYDFAAKTEHRLDFWWHGRGEMLSEASFMANPQGASGIIPAPGALILHPYGRYCNANKLAGEIDTLECLEHARKHYQIDENRLVARGFSMGGAACWQFAVHYPTLWCANAPGAGFAETPEFLEVFQHEKLDPTWYEKKLWHLYNATDTALNIFNLPTIAYSGEVDTQKQAADVMAREMKKLGLELTHIIGPKTGHGYEKAAKEDLNNRIDAIVAQGKPAVPKEIKFVTYTLRYNHCAWLTVEGLEKHWEQGKVIGQILDGRISVTTENVSALSITVPGNDRNSKVRIDGSEEMLLRVSATGVGEGQFHKIDGKWTVAGRAPASLLRKIHGLQGPIDDAFLDRFVMVKPTGQPANAKSGEWVEKEMKHAVDQWRSQFRGNAPVKKDTEITDDDIKTSNLILWGDPTSNAVLAKVADKLPINWTEKGVTEGAGTSPVGTHVPVLIYPNPLNPSKYVVLNSGFTFREYDYLNNARQVPKLPDYAVIDITTPPNSRYPGKIVRAGFFGEKWEVLPDDGK